MALPKAAQKQVDEANRLLNLMQTPPAPETKDESVEKDESKAELTVVNNDKEESETEAVGEEKFEEVEDEEVEVEPDPPKEDFEQRYKVLQGKYDTEVPRLHNQLRNMERQIEDMQALIASMKEDKPKEPEPTNLVTAEEREEFGDELIDLVGRRAKEVYDPIVSQLRSEISELKNQLGGVSQSVGKTARERMLDQLDDKVENWQELNDDAEFLEWLSHADPYSGETRGVMLRKAYNSNDVARVAAFFNGFKNEHAVVGNSDAAGSKGEANPRTPAVDLNEQVAPGKTQRSSSPSSAQEPRRMWTRQQISEFYGDVARGKFKDDPKMQKAIEREIFKATAEGRLKD